METLQQAHKLASERKADSDSEEEREEKLLEGAGMFQTMKGVATGSCSGYGYPNEHILNAGVMADKELLKQKGPEAVEIDEIIRGLNATTVGAYYRGHDEPPERHMTVSLDCIKSLMDGVDHINHDQSFSLDIVCKDFEPYKGDLVEIEFSEQGDPQSRKAISVKPLKHYHINEVCITRADGRTGVLEDTIFFTLDSLKLPSGYVPQRDDIVNVVAVRSIQSPYFWRAITMTPVQVS
ncbi:cancer/testis antigen 55-like isoform X2 [Alexandromys fortis]|uniref:cancer/testis antigen 55-like isoform X2 n=1 Tax=Alexandromys fortis TaxID=100897 RepID=UPI00215236CB|nr:cancer/testis antigen 55-like isoform X2 [Microtus fortis]XP_049988970.1 cancer/testis antigen 55-like isoform X2 [Microtus fortis]